MNWKFDPNRIINDLTSTRTDASLSAAQGKLLNDSKLAANEKGAANGVATLNSSGKVPSSQLALASSTADGMMASSDKINLNKIVALFEALNLSVDSQGYICQTITSGT